MVVNIDVEVLLLPGWMLSCVFLHRRLPLLLSRFHLDVRVHFAEKLGVVGQMSTEQVHAESTLIRVLIAFELPYLLSQFFNRLLLFRKFLVKSDFLVDLLRLQ